MPPVDGLEVVLLLLQLEDVLHEELLQVLVGEVDAELLERVRLEVLEAENVQDPDLTPASGVLQVGSGTKSEVISSDNFMLKSSMTAIILL